MDTFTQEQAAAFVRDAEWHVYRRQKWTYKFTSRTLVRYIECAPMREEVAAALIDYLTSEACSDTLTLEHKRIGGEWTPVTAWYDSDDQHTDRTTGLPRVRLYHAVRLGPEEEGGDGPYFVENGCAWKVSFKFFWNQPDPPDDLPASSSGINYRFTSIQRDQENGLWSYILEKRERVQQDVAKFTRVDNAIEKLEEEQHLGVKEGDALDAYKLMAGVDANTGTVTTVDVRKNEDCTSDVTLRYQTRKAGDVGAVCQKDLYKHEHTAVKAAQAAPASADVAEPSGGVTIRRQSDMREDGKYDIRETTTTEQPVSHSEYAVEQDLYQTVTEAEDDGQAADGADETAAGGTGGESIRKSVRKSPGDLRTKRTRTVTERPVTDAEKTVTQDKFSTRTETVDRSGNAVPDEPAAAGGANGQVIAKTVSKTRGDKRDKRTVTTQERGVTLAEKTVTETVFETVTETTDRNQENGVDWTADIPDGQRKTNRITPGGWNDIVTRTVSDKADVPAGIMRKKDLYGTDVRGDTRGVASETSPADVGAGGTGGETRRVDYARTDTGAYTKQLTVHKEFKVINAKKLDTGDANSTTVETQTYADDTAPTVVAFQKGKIRIYRSEKTPGGKFVVVETTETATDPEHQTLTWNDSGGFYTLDLYWNQTTMPTIDPTVYSGRRTVQPHFSRNRFGLYDGSILVHAQPSTTNWKAKHSQWWPGDFQKTGLTRKYVTMVRYDDTWYKRVKTVTYTYGYNDDVQNGNSSTQNKGLEEFISGGLEGSKVQAYGPGAYYWKVTKIEIKDTAVSSPVNTSETAS